MGSGNINFPNIETKEAHIFQLNGVGYIVIEIAKIHSVENKT